MSTKLFKLDATQVGELQQAARTLADLLPEFDDLEACGIDCSGARVIHQQGMSEIGEMLTRFSSVRPGEPNIPRE